jgi:hypothetical protein
MSRAAIHKDEFTPFGLWIKEYLDQRMTVTNIDYLLVKIEGKNLMAMLVEEKTNGGKITPMQSAAYRFLHDHLTQNNGQLYEFRDWGEKVVNYWGFYLLTLRKNATMPGPGMTLNNKPISVSDLVTHMDFQKKHCDGILKSWREPNGKPTS